MSNEPSRPLNFTASTTKSDGRTWLHLKRSDGASAALSCQTSHDSGETIASQVVTEFAAALNEAADALEGGVTVTDEMVERYLIAVSLASGDVHDCVRTGLQAALSAPAQRVEEGLELEIGDGALTWRGDGYSINVTADEAVLCVRGVGAQIVAVGDDLLNAVHDASPAPAPHAGVDADVPDYDAGLLNDFGGGDVSWWQDYLRAEIERANQHWRAALGDRT